ncbi:MAG TPA: hypothetical protein VHJ17_23055 [Thermomonospora sp.]|nr:hypothetical protein [Thermomonospora sp.]
MRREEIAAYLAELGRRFPEARVMVLASERWAAVVHNRLLTADTPEQLGKLLEEFGAPPEAGAQEPGRR